VQKVQRGADLPKDNEAQINAMDDKMLGMSARPLLTLIAQCLDMAANDGSCWISIGCTRKLDSFVLTVHQPEGPLSLYANDMGVLLTDASTLL